MKLIEELAKLNGAKTPEDMKDFKKGFAKGMVQSWIVGIAILFIIFVYDLLK